MKLIFLTFAPLRSNAGHLARLILELDNLSRINEVSIACLGKDFDDDETKKKYPNISFFSIPLSFSGWSVVDIENVLASIIQLIEKIEPDLTVLQMEVWDLMKGLSEQLKRTGFVFACMAHAMPFLVAPINPTLDFENDVLKYVSSDIAPYRKEYILNNYKDAREGYTNHRFQKVNFHFP